MLWLRSEFEIIAHRRRSSFAGALFGRVFNAEVRGGIGVWRNGCLGSAATPEKRLS
jgi:hypothetical protein